MIAEILLAFALGVVLAVPARWLGVRFGFHAKRGIAATGGLALLSAWVISVSQTATALAPRTLLAIAIALILLITVGLRDVRRALGPLWQLLAQVAAAGALVLGGGMVARAVTNPLGGLFDLTQWTLSGFPVLGAAATIVWLVTLMNAMNFLDGTDGLAATVGIIGFATIGAVSLLPHVHEPAVALPAFLAMAATAGFLFWNLSPARLYLGTAGAWLIGLLLGVLSVQGSSKIATLSVVGAIPLLDAVAVILVRLRRGASPFQGDRSHLHHRLAARGWTPWRIVALYAALSAALGVAAVVLPTPWKVLVVVTAGSAVVLAALLGRRVDAQAARS